MHTWSTLAWAISLLPMILWSKPAVADTDGFDSSMDMPMSVAQGTMTSFLHFKPGDTLWIQGWVPGKSGTLFGACLALFLLGIAARWTTALRAGIEAAILKTYSGNERLRKPSDIVSPTIKDIFFMRSGTLAPFVVSHAWARLILHGAQATFTVLFMLTVMTFQVSFILSLAIGVGFGEMMYGRFIDAARSETRSSH